MLLRQACLSHRGWKNSTGDYGNAVIGMDGDIADNFLYFFPSGKAAETAGSHCFYNRLGRGESIAADGGIGGNEAIEFYFLARSITSSICCQLRSGAIFGKGPAYRFGCIELLEVAEDFPSDSFSCSSGARVCWGTYIRRSSPRRDEGASKQRS